jgi:hypothetical protein
MGKADRNRQLSAQARIADMQAQQRRAEQRRRLLLVFGSIFLVIVVVVGFIVIKALQSPAKQAASSHGGLPSSVVSDVVSVPVSTLTKVGAGALPPVSQLPLKSISDTSLTTVNGKPEMLYIGAEFCPYCAAMRWSMAVALSRFGTFGTLKGIHSSASDVYPNTATLTFYKQRYTSSYVTFTPVENENITHGALQPTTKAEQALWVKYDTQNGGLGYPFIYFGGKAIITGPLYSPAVLKGLTWSQIASQLSNPNSTVAQNVIGAANYVTASICKMTNNNPGSVCKAAPITSIEPTI